MHFYDVYEMSYFCLFERREGVGCGVVAGGGRDERRVG